jgi:hypothetical protein
VPAVKVKKESAPPVKKEKLWQEEKLELQATLAHHPDGLRTRRASAC